MKINNRGISLIEVIVVVAIMMVLTATSVSAMSYLVRGNAKKAAKTIYSFVTQSRTDAMTKSGDWTLTIKKSGDNFVLVTECTGFSLGGVLQDCLDSAGNAYDKTVLDSNVTGIMCGGIAIDDANSCVIKFKKSTGEVDKINGHEATASSGGYMDIVVSLSGNTRTLRLYYLTGKIEQQ